MSWLETKDIAFTIFHIGITLFNLFGWFFYELRRLHLLSVLITLMSWLLLGLFYGFGYCFLTDWHWDVKRKLGETGLPSSFVKYYLDMLFNADIPASLVDSITVVGLVAAVVMTVLKNRDLFKKCFGH
ncbi:DUF2784 domain-containing protein [Fulvivirga sp. 29W222]|uniref:DUF2784 domain-containing protein n=1 Tax=Fulvivirga marina TaxID=2494733 RepID=A0A937KD15_9BACT|nr:DUF2784 domain-containing protein [Fulvivirga marina]MBL6448681.1 DUF2784 domain-containing protein [Fulvivirga marina]